MKRKIKSKRFPVRKKGKSLTNLERAKAAGEKYATDQMRSTHFDDWVRDQLIEAHEIEKEDPDRVLPLKNLDDARVVAKNMLKQLEWATKRELNANDIERITGIEFDDYRLGEEFWRGFHKALVDSEHWLAEQVLHIKRELRGAHESKARLGAPRPGTRVRDYIAVDNRGRKIAGPFKSYADAKHAAGPGGHTQFVPSARAPRRRR